tara:strand:- start:878 stop:1591 length:714 start_codon:yes stop_codon:yes gene_type:complete
MMAPHPVKSDAAVEVLQYSPGRSGSTMLYHVLQHLGTNVQKTHECVQTEAKVVITYRHPCDVFCSFSRISQDLDGEHDLERSMRRWWNPLVHVTMNRGIRYVRKGYARLQKYLDSDMELCFLRYERFKDDYDYLFNSLEPFLQLSIPRVMRDQVREATSFEKNKSAAAAFGSFKEFDAATLLHGKHLGSGAVDQWRNVCPHWMQRRVEKQLRDEIELYDSLAHRFEFSATSGNATAA